MTATQLSRACWNMLDGAGKILREQAESVFTDECQICRLHHKGAVIPNKNQDKALGILYDWLIKRNLGRYL